MRETTVQPRYVKRSNGERILSSINLPWPRQVLVNRTGRSASLTPTSASSSRPDSYTSSPSMTALASRCPVSSRPSSGKQRNGEWQWAAKEYYPWLFPERPSQEEEPLPPMEPLDLPDLVATSSLPPPQAPVDRPKSTQKRLPLTRNFDLRSQERLSERLQRRSGFLKKRHAALLASTSSSSET